MRSILLSVFTVFLTFNLFGVGNWSTQKTAGAKTVCYHGSSTMYCAKSPNKKTKEKDLKQFLSVFMQFSDETVSKNEMLLHPGIKRLVKSSRKTEGARVLKGVNDFLKREAKRKKISISTGKDKSSQKVFSEEDQKNRIDAIQWHKFVEVSIDDISCTPDEIIKLNLNITNSLKNDLIIKRDQVEIRIMSSGNQIMTVGSIEVDKAVIDPGKTVSFPIKIQMTGDMNPLMGYQLVPIIKNVNVLKEKPYVKCKK